MRLNKLEKFKEDVSVKIGALEKKYEVLYTLIDQKAEKSSLRSLEEAYMQMRDIINDLSNHFAERIGNEDAHNLLSANLRNLYELFINHNHDKPNEMGGGIMNGLMNPHCAGCARPNQNSGMAM